MRFRSLDWRLILLAMLDLSSGCATPAPAVETCVTDWKGQILYCQGKNGPEQPLPMSQAPILVCHPPEDEAAYIKYCRSKGQ